MAPVDVRPSTNSAPSRLTVVGTALINDTMTSSPGMGAVVAPDWTAQVTPGSTPNAYVLRLRPGADRAAFRSELERVFPGEVTGPVKQDAIRNVERIRHLPYLLVGLVAVLAVASLVHALVLSVRRQQRHLAVLKTLGFTRRQVAAAVASHATTLVVPAVLVGIPPGVIAGRWGWRIVATQLGVASGPVLPVGVVAVAGLAAVVVANVVATGPAWRASRLRAAEALRVE